MAGILRLKKKDLQPYYYAQVKDAGGNAVDLTGASIVCTLKDVEAGTLKIDRKSTGINVSDAAGGQFEYRWQSGDTDVVGKYFIEFEITPAAGGKFTVPVDSPAVVLITDSLDAQ